MDCMMDIKERIALLNHEERVKDVERNYFVRHELEKCETSFLSTILVSSGNLFIRWGVLLRKVALGNSAGDISASKTVPLASRR